MGDRRAHVSRSPRRPPFIDEKSYSGRNVSASGFLGRAFFILFPLVTAGEPRADDPRPGLALSVGHNQDSIAIRLAKQDEAMFILGVARIWLVHGKRVTEDGRGLGKRDAMFSGVRERLLRIPFEFVSHQYILHSAGTPIECG